MDTANQAARLTVRPLAGGDSEWASSLVAAHFGSVKVVSRGVLHDTHRLPGLVVEQAGVPVGILQYRVDGRSCEIVTLVAAVLRRGIGGALLRAIVEVAHRKDCNRTWLVTTNDNTPAQAFYRAMGWRKVTVHRGATAEARRLKPEIPKTGWAGIPIEDEVEFEFRLALEFPLCPRGRQSLPTPPASQGIICALPGCERLWRHARIALRDMRIMEFHELKKMMSLDMDRIQALASGMEDRQARWRPSPNLWSILEVINHLLDEEREDFRVRLDIILHRPQDPWPPIDPGGWVVQRAYNTRALDKSLRALSAERRRSLSWLDSLSAPEMAAECPSPFGPIRAGDMFAAWVTHDQLHIRQLVELHRAYTELQAAPYLLDYAGAW
jgi:GNAT superfamily N-acetyltransferase